MSRPGSGSPCRNRTAASSTLRETKSRPGFLIPIPAATASASTPLTIPTCISPIKSTFAANVKRCASLSISTSRYPRNSSAESASTSSCILRLCSESPGRWEHRPASSPANPADPTSGCPTATSNPRPSHAPESDMQRMIIESRTGDLSLFDGRNQHNNGWFVVRSLVPAGATKNAIDWTISPNPLPGWKYTPVVHVSQVGYHPAQKKVAIIELDSADRNLEKVSIQRIAEDGTRQQALSGVANVWGKFLRYQYLQFDFSAVKTPGVYEVEYGNSRSQVFRIAPDVYQRGVWQPVLEYFLPVQMCHMRVEEQYRVWHGACHLDDARMAPVHYNHFDGYLQGPDTLTRFQPGVTIPGMNAGGWHDAGDDDLRIESQADEVSILARAYEAFGLDYDDTTVDESERIARIHQPDGKPDALQQIEHGVLTVLGSYRAMGRFYRGIITPTLHQYTMLGDESNSTDNLFYDSSLKSGDRTATRSGKPDDRLLFTEQNAGHEYKGIPALAACARVLKKLNT